MRREVKTLLGREDRGLGSRERGTDWRKSWGRSWARDKLQTAVETLGGRGTVGLFPVCQGFSKSGWRPLDRLLRRPLESWQGPCNRVILVGLVQCVTPGHIFFVFFVRVYMYGLRPNY